MTHYTPNGVATNLKIAQDAATPGGFNVTSLTTKTMQRNAQYKCAIMVKAGVLFIGNFGRRILRYFTTQAAADAFMLGTKPLRKGKTTDAERKRQALIAFFLKKSSTPEGCICADGLHLYKGDVPRREMRGLLADGLVFKAFQSDGSRRYFSTQAAADEYTRQREAVKRVRVRVRVLNPQPVKAAKATKTPKAPKPRPVKPAALSYGEVAFLRSAAAKPDVVPDKNAEIIWPAHIKPICRLMPERHAVDVPMRRIGEAGWSMSVGGSA